MTTVNIYVVKNDYEMPRLLRECNRFVFSWESIWRWCFVKRGIVYLQQQQLVVVVVVVNLRSECVSPKHNHQKNERIIYKNQWINDI